MIDYMEKIIMKCPNCGSSQLTNTCTRDSTFNRVRRRRLCLDCNYKFTTYEVYSEDGKSDSIPPSRFCKGIPGPKKKDKQCRQ